MKKATPAKKKARKPVSKPKKAKADNKRSEAMKASWRRRRAGLPSNPKDRSKPKKALIPQGTRTARVTSTDILPGGKLRVQMALNHPNEEAISSHMLHAPDKHAPMSQVLRRSDDLMGEPGRLLIVCRDAKHVEHLKKMYVEIITRPVDYCVYGSTLTRKYDTALIHTGMQDDYFEHVKRHVLHGIRFI